MLRFRFMFVPVCLLIASLIPAAAQDAEVEGKLTPAMKRQLEEQEAPYRVWVFFADKGLLTAKSKEAAIARVAESYNPRAVARRELRGRHAMDGGPVFDARDLPVHEPYVSAVLDTGAEVRVRSRWVNAVSASATEKQIDALTALPFVAKVQPVARSRRPELSFSTSVEAEGRANAALDLDYGRADGQLSQINLVALHEAGFTGEGVLVGILDSGFRRDHVAFHQPGHELEVVAEYDFVDDDPDTSNEPGDPGSQHDHGTKILGTLGSYFPGELVGGAFNASYALAKTEDTTAEYPAEEDNYVAGLEYLEAQGVDMTTSSLGYIDWYTQEDLDGETAVTTIAMNTMNEHGVHSVTAAGNSSHDTNPSTSSLIAPADAFLVITAGSVDSSGNISSFSSDGPTADGRVKPELLAQGSSTWTISSSNTTSYTTASGTSLSTPLVAGAVACLIEANPHWTVEQMREELFRNADYDPGGLGFDPDYVRGYGILDARATDANSQTLDGVVLFRSDLYSCNDTLEIILRDDNIPGDPPTIDIELTSTTEVEPEIVTLTQLAPGSGRYRADYPTTGASPVNGDGALSVIHGDTLTASYVDADDGAGGTNVTKTDTALADCLAPAISGVESSDIDDVSARITWTTDEGATSLVRYGPAEPPDQEVSRTTLTSDHSIPLTGLSECTIYKYEVESADARGNTAIDDNAGTYYKFETYRNDPELGLVPCHKGVATLDEDDYGCAGTVTASVTDIDLNSDPGVEETLEVLLTSTSEPDGEWVTLTELDSDNSRFEGSIPLDAGPAQGGDGLLAIAPGDLITVTYHDEDTGDGTTGTSTFTAHADCVGPDIDSVRVADITAERAAVEWDTDEPSTSRVDWGTTPALGQVVENSALVQSHRLILSGLDTCERVYFRVSGVDGNGNVREADAGGAPFSFNANEIGGLVYYDDFETDQGWELPGEWEIGPPQGLGSHPNSAGAHDPEEAYSGTGVLGVDLSGQGANPGNYEPNDSATALTPVLDTSGRHNLELIIKRRLGTASGDKASVILYTAGINTVWGNQGTPINELSWREIRWDIGDADNKPAVRVGFGFESDASGQSYGWNIDELIIKDSTHPDYEACQTCAGAPTFGGLTAVRDDAPCAAGGLTLEWSAAPAWGTGSGGTYEVHRGDTPDLVPDTSNRIATGLTATTWTDAGAPVGQPVWYVVRARNNESCAGSAGLADDNLVRVAGTETISQPDAGSPGAGLMVRRVGGAHVRLEWGAAAAADHYVVRRSESADFADPVDLGEPAVTLFEDEGAAANARTYFYAVWAANACGQETP